MREILFRGKRIDNGEWVEGALLDGENHCLIGQSIKFSPDILHECKLVGFEVGRKTICQYTGLTDKNGRKIWENDIVEITEEVDDRYIVLWDKDAAGYVLIQNGDTMYDFNDYYSTDMRVIGNIFDNPELMEDEQC